MVTGCSIVKCPMGQLVVAILAALLVVPGAFAADVVTVSGVRTWAAPDHTRVVLDLTDRVSYKYFKLDHPKRLVVDLAAAAMPASRRLPNIPERDLFLKGIRHGPYEGSLRLVLDLKSEVNLDVFVLEPHRQHSHRLVIDLMESRQKVKQATAAPTPPLPVSGAKGRAGAGTVAPSPPLLLTNGNVPVQRAAVSPGGSGSDGAAAVNPVPPLGAAGRDVVVAVDAGHGGDDPGAVGKRHGTHEKDVVLHISKMLAGMINAEPGMRAVLVREGDYFVTLGGRVRKARDNRADVFVSIHADSFKDPSVSGSSVYVLSRKRATSEHAKWLADRENASDLVGGVNIASRDDLLASVLLDLSQTAAMQASSELAADILGGMGKVSRLHKRRVEAASFMVLGAPDVPSVLVETGFISNPEDELKLRDSKYREKMARSILGGLREYFQRRPPDGSSFAIRQAEAGLLGQN